jgi:hypothetical protein
LLGRFFCEYGHSIGLVLNDGRKYEQLSLSGKAREKKRKQLKTFLVRLPARAKILIKKHGKKQGILKGEYHCTIDLLFD